MKKLGLLLTGLVVFGLMSCEEVDKFTQFDMNFTTSVTIPASTGIILPFDLLTPETTTNAETTFGNNDTNKESIEEIVLKEMTMEITAPGDRDFDFLEEIRIFINADGLSELEIATKINVPEDVDMITLEVNSNDIKEYIKKDKFQLRVKTITDENLDTDVDIEVNSVFAVDAKILGV